MATTTTTYSTPLPQRYSHGGAPSSSATTTRKAHSTDTDSKGIWLSMLDEVSRGKDLAEKHLIILGAHTFTNSSFKPPSGAPPRLPLLSPLSDPHFMKQEEHQNNSATFSRHSTHPPNPVIGVITTIAPPTRPPPPLSPSPTASPLATPTTMYSTRTAKTSSHVFPSTCSRMHPPPLRHC
jgi:hypothetical protein